MMENLKDWAQKRLQEVADSGWRRYGEKVGDTVQLCCTTGWDSVQEYDTGFDYWLPDGLLGEITTLMPRDTVMVRFIIKRVVVHDDKTETMTMAIYCQMDMCDADNADDNQPCVILHPNHTIPDNQLQLL